PAMEQWRRVIQLQQLLWRHMLFPPIVDGIEIVEAFVKAAAITLINRPKYLMESKPFSDRFSISGALRLVAVSLQHRGRAGDVERAHHRNPVIPASPRGEVRHRFLAPSNDFRF